MGVGNLKAASLVRGERVLAHRLIRIYFMRSVVAFDPQSPTWLQLPTEFVPHFAIGFERSLTPMELASSVTYLKSAQQQYVADVAPQLGNTVSRSDTATSKAPTQLFKNLR